jgi:hypothetical protein
MPVSSRSRVFFLPLTAILLAIAPFLVFSARVNGQPPPEQAAATGPAEAVPTDSAAVRPPVVEGLTAGDTPGDEGGSMTVTWTEPSGAAELGLTYKVMRADSPDGQYTEICELAAGESEYMDAGLTDGQQYCYKVLSVVGPSVAESDPTLPGSPRGNWFRMFRLNALVLLIIFSGSVLFYIARARGGKPIYIRKIAGLNAVDEAVGRATEMGKKILYIPGIMSIDEIQTIASLAILGHVAKLSAQYNADLEVPNKDPLTFASARETVKEAYLEAGRPDLYREEMVNYVTYDQFAYTASVTGKMVREKPATNFLIGSFYAESLLLAETGQSVGAIQISGTAEVAQLPFFVVACDYTLIGEELYAASAYLSREPVLLGSIKGQDLTKLLLMLALGLGVILESFGLAFVKDAFRMQ